MQSRMFWCSNWGDSSVQIGGLDYLPLWEKNIDSLHGRKLRNNLHSSSFPLFHIWEISRKFQAPLFGRIKSVSSFSVYLPYARLVCSLARRKKKPRKILSLMGIKLCLCILSTTPHSIVNTVGRTYMFGMKINAHAFPMIPTKLENMRTLLPLLLILCRRYANAT